MNPERTRKIVESIAECDRYIAKEGARSADLRPANIAKLLEQYKAHRAELYAMLVTSHDEALAELRSVRQAIESRQGLMSEDHKLSNDLARADFIRAYDAMMRSAPPSEV